jgi:hypothetical protein
MGERKMINNKKLAAATVNDDNEQPEKVGWWINELDSLGIEKSNNNSEPKDRQVLEDLADDIKQTFIHDYKICYSDNIIQR